jgi:hypothetical protein
MSVSELEEFDNRREWVAAAEDRGERIDKDQGRSAYGKWCLGKSQL